MRGKSLVIVLTLIALCAITLPAQRRITPVKPAAAAGEPQPLQRDTTRVRIPSSVVHLHDDNGNVILVDTLTGREVPDTLSLLPAPPKMEYPLLSGFSAGVDLWDPLMRAFGNHYGLISFSLGVNLHNRYRPIVEVGVSDADFTPDDGNFSYKSKIAPFFKIGADYNFLYNSNPDYEVYAGLRFGFTPFSFEVTDVTVNNNYWDVSSRFDIPSQSVTASFFEVLFGVKVKLWGPISAGWQIKYHSLISDGNPRYGQPWYIPGYGTRRSNWSGGFSIFYTFHINHQRADKVDNQDDTPSDTEQQP